MPKNKLKPVIRYSRYELAGYDNYRGATKYLCLPLTPASRKVMIDAIAQAMRDSNGTPEALTEWKRNPQLVPMGVYAEAALSALEKLGDGKP